MSVFFFFFNDTATTEIYTLSLHDALPISESTDLLKDVKYVIFSIPSQALRSVIQRFSSQIRGDMILVNTRSEEHTSELQSRQYLVCRLLLEKKKKYII